MKGIYDPYTINRERADNKIRFNQKYLDKIISIRGKVGSINDLNPPRPDLVSVIIHSTEPEIGAYRSIFCRGISTNDAANLKRDEIVTIQGTFRKMKHEYWPTITLEECKVVSR